MKMIYYPYDFKCEFYSGKCNVMTIEDKIAFTKLVEDFEDCIVNAGQHFYFEEDDKEVSASKYISLISSPLDLKYTKKDYQKVLFNRLTEEIQINDMENEIADVYAELMQKMDGLISNVHFEIEYDDDVDYSAIFKMLNIELEQPKGNFVEKLIDYMTTYSELMNAKVFVIANCSTFINKEWYNEIAKWGEYQNVIIIFVENAQHDYGENINEYILDEDMCQIH